MGRVLLEKPTVPHVVNKFPAFNGTQSFITMFKTALVPIMMRTTTLI
jgi:hypothetical protein